MEIRLPNINGQTEAEQLAQIRSYLYQFAEQLNLAFGRLEEDEKSANITYGSQAVSQSASAVEKAQVDNTFSEIKGLLIKSADFVEAFNEEITKTLNGQYVAKSEFGTFIEDTQANLYANSKAVGVKFKDEQYVESDASNIEYTAVRSANAWAKVGLLGYEEDGDPIYGMEIGQINTSQGDGANEPEKKMARYTSSGIELYGDESVPVAIITEDYIKITNAIFKNSVILGGYKMVVDTDNGIEFKWVGGE